MTCPYCQSPRTLKKGFYQNLEKTRRQRRYCRSCRRYFSECTGSLLTRQKRPELNRQAFALLISGVSQRRVALLIGTTRRTVERKLVLLSRLARIYHAADLGREPTHTDVTFDEMETFEHTKCKPVAIAVAVSTKSRKIIAAHVAKMPAKGKLAPLSRRRYGRRVDDRPKALRALLRTVKVVSIPTLILRSDQSPRYPKYVREILPEAIHKTYKGRRGCVVGQGELKAGGYDPLFALNHSCAMFRDNIKRLSRRTWCTTKRPDRLQCLVDLYVVAHNAMISRSLRQLPRKLLTEHQFLSPAASEQRFLLPVASGAGR